MSRSAQPAVLLVDDEPHSLAAMRMALEEEFKIFVAADADAALEILAGEWVQAVLCDQRMPGRTGTDLLAEVRARWPEVVRIIISGYTDPAAMTDAINAAGIYQFLTKPWHPDQLLSAARNAARLFALAQENQRLVLEMRELVPAAESRLETLRRALREKQGFEAILRAPESPIEAAITRARRFASFDVPVLICGEHGTGKAQFARAMHHASLRGDQTFQEFDAAGLQDEQVMLQLFGAQRGALPGLAGNRFGLMHKADRGTLFIAGVELLSEQVQLMLVHFLRTGQFLPMGANDPVRSNLRLIAGTAAKTDDATHEGRLRPDLRQLLAVGEVNLPPLRVRRADLPLLAEASLAEFAEMHDLAVRGFDDAVFGFMEGYDWPGNIPELRNEVARMVMLSDTPLLEAGLLSRHVLSGNTGPQADDTSTICADPALVRGALRARVEVMERHILSETLARHRGNKSRAAEELGLSRVGLRGKLDRYGLSQETSGPVSDSGSGKTSQ